MKYPLNNKEFDAYCRLKLNHLSTKLNADDGWNMISKQLKVNGTKINKPVSGSNFTLFTVLAVAGFVSMALILDSFKIHKTKTTDLTPCTKNIREITFQRSNLKMVNEAKLDKIREGSSSLKTELSKQNIPSILISSGKRNITNSVDKNTNINSNLNTDYKLMEISHPSSDSTNKENNQEEIFIVW